MRGWFLKLFLCRYLYLFVCVRVCVCVSACMRVHVCAFSVECGTVFCINSKTAQCSSKNSTNQYTAEDTSTIPAKGTSPYPSIPDIDVTLNGVRNLLLKSDFNKSAGPNNIHTCCPFETYCFWNSSFIDSSIPAVIKKRHSTSFLEISKRHSNI